MPENRLVKNIAIVLMRDFHLPRAVVVAIIALGHGVYAFSLLAAFIALALAIMVIATWSARNPFTLAGFVGLSVTLVYVWAIWGDIDKDIPSRKRKDQEEE